MVQAQCTRLASNHPQAADLLNILCYLNPYGISLPILVDGARSLRSPPTKIPRLSQHISLIGRLKPPPSDPSHPLRTLLDAITSEDELHNLVRCLQHISLVRLETVHPPDITKNKDPLRGQPSHVLHIPKLVRDTVRRGMERKDEDSAYFGMTVGIIVSAFVQRRHDSSLWSPFIKHLASLSRWELFLREHPPRRLNAACQGALHHATEILVHFDKKVKFERKLKIDRKIGFDGKIKLESNLRELQLRTHISRHHMV